MTHSTGPRDGLASPGCAPPSRRLGGRRVGLDSAQRSTAISRYAISAAGPGLVSARAYRSASLGDEGDESCVHSQFLPEGVGDYCHLSVIADKIVQVHIREGEIAGHPSSLK